MFTPKSVKTMKNKNNTLYKKRDDADITVFR